MMFMGMVLVIMGDDHNGHCVTVVRRMMVMTVMTVVTMMVMEVTLAVIRAVMMMKVIVSMARLW